MRVTGKVALLVLLLGLVSQWYGSYNRLSPALFEAQLEQTNKEVGTEVKTGDKKDIRFLHFFDFDDDLVGAVVGNTYYRTDFGSFVSYGYHGLPTLSQSLPLYLLFCQLKVFCR